MQSVLGQAPAPSGTTVPCPSRDGLQLRWQHRDRPICWPRPCRDRTTSWRWPRRIPAAAQDDAAAHRLEGWLAGVERTGWAAASTPSCAGASCGTSPGWVAWRRPRSTPSGRGTRPSPGPSRPQRPTRRDRPSRPRKRPGGWRPRSTRCPTEPSAPSVWRSGSAVRTTCWHPYVERYLRRAEAISANRDGWATRGISLRTNVLRFLFPVPRDLAPFLDRLDTWRAADRAGRIGAPADRGGSGQRGPRAALPGRGVVTGALVVGDVLELLDALYPPRARRSLGRRRTGRRLPGPAGHPDRLRRRLHHDVLGRGATGGRRPADHPSSAVATRPDRGRSRAPEGPAGCRGARRGGQRARRAHQRRRAARRRGRRAGRRGRARQRASAAPRRDRRTGAMDKIVTFVPADHVAAVIDALAAAGAGRIGHYERCAFTSTGEGTFRPRRGRRPLPLATSAGPSTSPRSGSRWCSTDHAVGRSATRCWPPIRTKSRPTTCSNSSALHQRRRGGLGRVGELTRPTTLGGSGRSPRLRAPGHGTRRCNVAGDLDRTVTRVAVQAGAGDDLIDERAGRRRPRSTSPRTCGTTRRRGPGLARRPGSDRRLPLGRRVDLVARGSASGRRGAGCSLRAHDGVAALHRSLDRELSSQLEEWWWRLSGCMAASPSCWTPWVNPPTMSPPRNELFIDAMANPQATSSNCRRVRSPVTTSSARKAGSHITSTDRDGSGRAPCSLSAYAREFSSATPR